MAQDGAYGRAVWYSCNLHSIETTPLLRTCFMHRHLGCYRAGLLLLLLLLGGCPSAGPPEAALPEPASRIRAVTLDAPEPPEPSTLVQLRELGVTHVALVSFGFQPALDVPAIRFDPEVRWFSESEAGVRSLARQADSLGLRLILKPQLWVGRGAWTAEIDFPTEAAWRQWEADYRALLMHTARLAEAVGADVLVIGTELGGPVQRRPAFWRGLIAEVRAVFGGRLTYAANWYEDYEHVPFWEALDYVGVQAYFPLSEAADPPLDVLKAAWEDHEADLARVAAQAGRPILFTEIGYRSVPYAAAEPWRWPSRDEHGTVDPDYALQARLYRAFFESVWEEPWFAGALVWKWYPEGRTRRRNVSLDFTPQQKPAEAVIARWFRGAAQ